MKTISLLFALFLLFSNTTIKSQAFNYTEQISGVTTSLNSVSMMGGYLAPQVWTCGDIGVVLKTTNQGSNWINVSGNGIPTGVNLVTISCKALDTALTAGNIGTTTYVYRTTNGGSSWTQVFTQPNGKINSVWMRNALSGFMTGNPVGGRWSLWKTTNGGANWDSTGMYVQQAGSETGWNNSLAIFNNWIWFGTNNSHIYRSTNFGLNWVVSPTSEINSSAVWVSGSDSMVLSAGGANEYFSYNGGTSWTPGSCPGTGNFNGFCSGIPGVLNYINYPGPMFTIRGNNNVYFAPGISNFMVEYTAPAGNYNHMASDFFDPRIPMQAQMFTWIVRSNGGITKNAVMRGGAVRTISSEVPVSAKLEQNYPNPFNPSTKIRFQLTKAGFTTIKIYNVLGSEVAAVVSEMLHAGIYETSFDAGNLASGIYYYKVETGSFTDVKKMVVLK